MRKPTLEERLLAKVQIYPDGCWFWTGAKSTGGYGHFYDGRGVRPAHRVSYEFYKGPIPDGLVLDHLCGHPSCVNPNHLEPVTERVNILRASGTGAINAKKTHCPQGHEYTEENTYKLPDGRRRCITCMKDYWLRSERRARRMAKSAASREAWSPVTHCKHGHPYDEDNTEWYHGKRRCRTCHSSKWRKGEE
jgi:HNH endonuclease